MRSQKRNLLISSSVIVIVLIGNNGANAQDADDTDDMDRIVVTGIRSSLEQAIDRKRNADAIVDSITAEAIGKFPDENIAESLQRVTGVQIERLRGEGNRVTIRGLPSEFTRVQFNGRSLASALTPVGFATPASRNFDFNALPSEFVASIDVFKSPTADLQEGGLAGTVSVNTPRPLDIGERTFSISAQGSYESNSQKVSPRANLLYNDVFAGNRLGVTFGIAYTQRKPETHGFVRNSWGALPEASYEIDWDGNGAIGGAARGETAFAMFQTLSQEVRERISGLGVVEYQATEGLSLYAEVFYTELDIELDSFQNLKRWVGAVPPRNTEVLELGPGRTTDQRALALSMDNVDLRGNNRINDRQGDTWSFATGADYTLGALNIHAKVAYSTSEQTFGTLGIEQRARVTAGYDCSIDDELCAVFFDGDQRQGNASTVPNDYQLLSINGDFNRPFEDDALDGTVDVDWDVDVFGVDLIEFGAFYGHREQFSEQPSLLINAAQAETLFGTLPRVAGTNLISAERFMRRVSPTTDFLDSYGGSAIQSTSWLSVDSRKFLSKFSDKELKAAGSISPNLANTIDVEEDIIAGYIKVNFASDSGALSGNAGVRIVYTDQVSRGFAPDLNGIETFPEFGNVTVVPDAGPVTVDNSYTTVLPSLNLKYDVTADLVARFSASRTMTRPTLSQISPSTTAAVQTQTITSGNPGLDPFIANNIDATLEWYFDDLGLISVTGFWKDVETLIRDEQSARTLTVTTVNGDGSRVPSDVVFVVNRPANAEGVKLKGVEVSYQQSFDGILPGILSNTGILANYTYVNNSDPEILVGTSNHNFNLQGYYETETLGVRLAYTWRDEFLTTPEGTFNDRFVEQSFATLDGNLTYNIHDNVAIVIEAINILNEAQFTIAEFGSQRTPREIEDFGRRVLFGVRAAL